MTYGSSDWTLEDEWALEQFDRNASDDSVRERYDWRSCPDCGRSYVAEGDHDCPMWDEHAEYKKPMRKVWYLVPAYVEHGWIHTGRVWPHFEVTDECQEQYDWSAPFDTEEIANAVLKVTYDAAYALTHPSPPEPDDIPF